MSIDSLYEGVLSRLTRMEKIVEISKELAGIKDMDEKVLYVYYLLRDLKFFPEIIVVEKTAGVSIYYRNLGNNCFQKSDDYRAWQYYNLSLLHAPNSSEHHALALANRSAVFFSMKKFLECMDDINKVFRMNYPEKLKEKLKKRQIMCQEMIKQNDTPNIEDDRQKSQIDNILSLTKKQCACEHQNVSYKLQVLRSKTMGAHVVAKEDIQVGEVLVKEEPYLNLLLKTQSLFACSYCLSRTMSLNPCDKCCFALYCSDYCKRTAWSTYHRIECPLMATLLHMEFTKLELLALRILIKARLERSNWNELYHTIVQVESYADTQFRGHRNVGDKMIFSSKFYESIHVLETNIDKRSISDIFQKCVSAAVLLRLLEIGTDFIDKVADEARDRIRRCVAETLFRHIMTSPTNMHGISSNIETEEGNFVSDLSIGSAPYGYLSLFNHSCCPNVVRSSKLGTSQMTMIALRPIKKGSQIFDNYGMHHAVEDLASRQSHLKSQYKFTCICEACTNNWPKFHNAKSGQLDTNTRKTYVQLLSLDVIEKLQKGDKATALKVFKPLCRLAEACEKYAPCKELFECQESIKQCLAIFDGVVPYGYSQVVEWKAIPPKV